MIRRLAAPLIGLTALFAAALTAPRAAADLVIDPTGGTSLVFSDPDNSARTRPLGFTAQFFGLDKTTVDISTNGNLNFGLNTSFADGAFPRSTARIAPLWDDLTLNSTGTIVEKASPGVYYSVTWENVFRTTSLNPSKIDTFQAVWFGASATVGGFTFQKNDIAFSYQMVNADFDSGAATVGINKGSSNAAAVLPGTTDGVITAATKNLLPITGPQFVLFRSDGLGGYVASIQTTAAVGATVTGSVSLEGVNDLSAVSPAAPLGLFHVELRQAGVVIKQADVTLTATKGGAAGTFSISGVAPGTYDVAIKGAKNLRVVVVGVVVGAAGGNVGSAAGPIELPAGDSNGDNSVDSSDFTALIGAFNSAATVSGSGYDPKADFNFDGFVDSSDFTLLIGQFNNSGQ